MKILIDENIPYAYELFSQFGEVKTISGRLIAVNELDDIDVLIIRSVTKINESLLAGKKVQFVGTVTAGTDHVDENWLTKIGIGFSSAQGCNAIAVVEYVLSSLLMLSERDSFVLSDRTIGIIGVGNIGSRLHRSLKALGVHTLLCDPPRADNNNDEHNVFYSLDELVTKCDILTFHVPLSKEGPYKSLHLVDEALIRRLRSGTILINTCRGPVVDNIALLRCLEEGQELSVILDVWESEPELNIALLKKVDIATAHIAGSTLEGKARGTIQIFESYSHFIGKPKQVSIDMLLPKPKFNCVTLHGSLDQPTLKSLVHLMYDVRRDDALLRKIRTKEEFDQLRQHYFERREWSSVHIVCDDIDSVVLLEQLGFNAAYDSSC